MSKRMLVALLFCLASLRGTVFSQQLNGRWVTVAVGDVLLGNAIVGGRDANGTVEIVCHALHDGGLHPGKIVAGNCNFGYNGEEIVALSYESPGDSVQVPSLHSAWIK
jgi:hypothetical protein